MCSGGRAADVDQRVYRDARMENPRKNVSIGTSDVSGSNLNRVDVAQYNLVQS